MHQKCPCTVDSPQPLCSRISPASPTQTLFQGTPHRVTSPRRKPASTPGRSSCDRGHPAPASSSHWLRARTTRPHAPTTLPPYTKKVNQCELGRRPSPPVMEAEEIKAKVKGCCPLQLQDEGHRSGVRGRGCFAPPPSPPRASACLGRRAGRVAR